MIRSKVVTVNEELAELQRKYQLLEGDRKTYYETSQWTIKQNRDTLSSVKRENKELRSQIQSLNVSRNGGGTRAELNRMREYAANLRKRYNFLHEILTKKQKLMERQLAEAKAVELDAELVLNDDTPTMRRIRRLEKMLQKAVIKYSEANNIRRTYEQIVKRLKEERIGFDNQLSAIARTLRAKDHDLEELLLMSHDANHAKEVAKAELERVDAQLLSDKQRREKDIAERRGQAKAKQDLNARLEAREKKRREYEEAMGRRTHDRDYRKLSHDPTEEELRRISIYEEAFRKIKEATGVTDPNEIIQKFLTQEETTSHLQQVTKEAQLKIDKLNEQHAQAKALVEEVKYSGAGLLGSRRIVDEYEAKLVEANTNLDRLQARYERVAKILINMRAGTEHLWDKLTVIKIDQAPVLLNNETIAEVLGQCEVKLLKAFEVFEGDEEVLRMMDEAEGMRATAGEALYAVARKDDPRHSFNIRVAARSMSKINFDIDMEETLVDDDDDDERDVPDRLFLKATALQVIQKATKRTKKKPRRFSNTFSPRNHSGSATPNALLTPSFKLKGSQGKKAEID